MIRLKQHWGSKLILCFLLFFSASSVFAAVDDAPTAGGTARVKAIKCSESPQNTRKLTEAVYDCVKNIIDKLATDMIVGVYNKASKAVTAVFTLAIMFFAIKFVLYGTRQPQAEFMVMLIKFTIVASLVFGINTGGGMIELRDLVLRTAAGLSNLVFTADDTHSIRGANIFAKMDNMIFKLYGIDPTKDLGVDEDAKGLQMLGGMLLTGPIGAKAFAEGTGVIALLVSSFMIALYVQVVALIALTFLFALSPIFIPFCLFTPTKGMFDKWLRQIISYSFQPMIVIAFLSIMLIVLNNLFGTFDNLVKKSAELANDPQTKKVATIFSTPLAEKSGKSPFQSTNTGSGMSISQPDSTVAGQGVGAVGGEAQKDQLVLGISAKDASITVSPMSKKDMESLLSELVLLMIVCATLFQFMRELPEWASELAGGDRQVPNLFKTQPIKQIDEGFNKKK